MSKWLWLAGAVALAALALALYRDFTNPAFILGLATTALGSVLRFAWLHRRDMTEAEKETYRQGGNPLDPDERRGGKH